MQDVSSGANIIDGRDVMERIAELEELCEPDTTSAPGDVIEPDEDDIAELAALRELANQCAGYGD